MTMRIPATILAAAVLGVALGGCQDAPPASAAKAPRVPSLVQGVCGDCHGVEAPFISPNPEAPGFDAIANSAGLTEETLGSWLIDAHNYPELMDFELSDEEAREVADYMLTLKGKQYRPAP
jgi:mono/diheme cytochrome c family protein